MRTDIGVDDGRRDDGREEAHRVARRVDDGDEAARVVRRHIRYGELQEGPNYRSEHILFKIYVDPRCIQYYQLIQDYHGL